MRFLAQLAAVASSLATLTAATALTYNLPANTKECFYAHVDNKGAKVAFYFAVRIVNLATVILTLGYKILLSSIFL